MGYSLELSDEEKGPQVPALSSTALPNLLESIDHLWLDASLLPEEAKPLIEHEDLLDALARKDAQKEFNTSNVYQKFLNVLDF